MEVKSLVGGLLAGAAIGVAIGILLAPASGRETRGKIIKRSKVLVDDLKNVVQGREAYLKHQSKTVVDDGARWMKEDLLN